MNTPVVIFFCKFLTLITDYVTFEQTVIRRQRASFIHKARKQSHLKLKEGGEVSL
jgi:hypothetical protein